MENGTSRIGEKRFNRRVIASRRCGLRAILAYFIFIFIFIYLLFILFYFILFYFIFFLFALLFVASAFALITVGYNMRCIDFFFFFFFSSLVITWMHGDRRREAAWSDRDVPCSDRERCLLLLLVCVAGCIVHKCPGEYATRRHAQGNDRTFCDATGPESIERGVVFVRVSTSLPLSSRIDHLSSGPVFIHHCARCE